MEDIPLVTAENVRPWTAKDPILARVQQVLLMGGVFQKESPEFKLYAARQTELSVQDGCILWGARVIVPLQGRKDVLQQLHQCHPGISRMKALARSYFWWPKLDDDIEALAKSCSTCQEHRKASAIAPLHPWEWPEKPWKRIHFWCFSTAWYGTVRFGTVHFWGVFHWVLYLVPGTFLVPPQLRFQASRTVTKT